MITTTIEFTKDEIDAALELIDIAVKAAGLQRAQNAFVIGAKLGAALEAFKPKANGVHTEANGVHTEANGAGAPPAA